MPKRVGYPLTTILNLDGSRNLTLARVVQTIDRHSSANDAPRVFCQLNLSSQLPSTPAPTHSPPRPRRGGLEASDVVDSKSNFSTRPNGTSRSWRSATLRGTGVGLGGGGAGTGEGAEFGGTGDDSSGRVASLELGQPGTNKEKAKTEA